MYHKWNSQLFLYISIKMLPWHKKDFNYHLTKWRSEQASCNQLEKKEMAPEPNGQLLIR